MGTGGTRHNSTFEPTFTEWRAASHEQYYFSPLLQEEIRALAEVSLTGPAIYQFARHAPRCSMNLWTLFEWTYDVLGVDSREILLGEQKSGK